MQIMHKAFLVVDSFIGLHLRFFASANKRWVNLSLYCKPIVLFLCVYL